MSNLSHTCEFALHDECLGVERHWDQRACVCRGMGKCPHTLSRPCECGCHEAHA